jgi:hypothetical protein
MEFEEKDTNHEWAQLREMEKLLKRHRRELLRQGIPESDNEDWGEHQEPEEDENDIAKEEDDSLDNGDLTYITTILDSFSRPKSNSEQLNASDYAIFTPEGTPMRVTAKQMTPQKFNQKFNQTFNQNSTSKHPAAENFSCFPTIWEEGPTELADYSDEEEDDSLDNEDILSEKDTGANLTSKNFSDEEDTWSKTEPDEFEFETHSEIDYEEQGDKTTFTDISSISLETAQAFSAWQPYIPPEPVFQSSSAQSWWLDSSPLASLSQEPTLIQISSIQGSNSTIGLTPIPIHKTQHERKTK